MLNTIEILNLVDNEGQDNRNDYYLYKLLGATKGYSRWILNLNSQPGDHYYQTHMDDCMLSKKEKMQKLDKMANAIVNAAIKLHVLTEFLEREDKYSFIRRHECAEEMLRICDTYGISLQRNFYEKAKLLEG